MPDGQDVIDLVRPSAPVDREEMRIVQTVGRLTDRLGDRVAPELLEARVRAFYASFEGAQVREFVPILVERQVMKELAGHRRRV